MNTEETNNENLSVDNDNEELKHSTQENDNNQADDNDDLTPDLVELTKNPSGYIRNQNQKLYLDVAKMNAKEALNEFIEENPELKDLFDAKDSSYRQDFTSAVVRNYLESPENFDKSLAEIKKVAKQDFTNKLAIAKSIYEKNNKKPERAGVEELTDDIVEHFNKVIAGTEKPNDKTYEYFEKFHIKLSQQSHNDYVMLMKKLGML